MQLHIFNTWDKLVTLPLISTQLKKIKISKKSLRKEASKRLYQLRDAYKLQISGYISKMLVCIDESAANKYTAYQKRGWSEYRIMPWVKRPLK